MTRPAHRSRLRRHLREITATDITGGLDPLTVTHRSLAINASAGSIWNATGCCTKR
ncbi:hypothetical protein [Actinomadura citrea]|uniref:Uncharacterized protein n=1 Tax=Actinomadura citrea TaxID=46158 RepID=A0A7Y9GED4_9ACTN|nr:hypothetical protein [Actinomadura citrea]NYE14940.1 hypothetical protein [Actinomadura citrea]